MGCGQRGHVLAQELLPSPPLLYVPPTLLPQVHRARLVGGEEVAVKLQYPGLRRSVQSDLGTMKRLSRLATTFFPDYSLGWLYDELEAKVRAGRQSSPFSPIPLKARLLAPPRFSPSPMTASPPPISFP